ncbi:hypothetical protein M419DRAFT_34015 [Trichoderma reesei RUT C-30]|uniref:Uncharacterized protein n=1 Tax=Hypocrea jecorina (strain ATCC 56765 / BCRC 32924 / NRRL 11460 / Rut C-30) TaxID=1344414 RepID=A0A024SF78_HYPJR|nr:hypothetical protein M419DRAFT_34015 [Trichoderma reesei RUT C-30]
MTASSDSPSGTPTQREAGAGPEGDLAQLTTLTTNHSLRSPLFSLSDTILLCLLHTLTSINSTNPSLTPPPFSLLSVEKENIKGEQAATAMEANLTTLESKLDALLAAFDSIEEDKKTGAKSTSPKTENDGKGK